MHKETGLPLAEGLGTTADLPHTISYAVLYRSRLDSFGELPKDKRPPRNIWDKPFALSEFFDAMWDTDDTKGKGKTEFYEYNEDDVE